MESGPGLGIFRAPSSTASAAAQRAERRAAVPRAVRLQNAVERSERSLAGRLPAANHFEQLRRLTRDRTLRRFPVDNEDGTLSALLPLYTKVFQCEY